MIDIADVVVRKPWGREYLCFRNEHVAIWVLHIKAGERTSLHAHPKKSTALILLDGAVYLSFVRGDVRLLGPLEKINIFRGRFHSTHALQDAVLLEAESPDDKHDLVRLEDSYGRVGAPYEGSEAFEQRGDPDEDLWISNEVRQSTPFLFAGCLFSISPLLLGATESDICVTLCGGLGHGLVPPGEAIDGRSVQRIAAVFPPLPHSAFLWIRKTK